MLPIPALGVRCLRLTLTSDRGCPMDPKERISEAGVLVVESDDPPTGVEEESDVEVKERLWLCVDEEEEEPA